MVHYFFHSFHPPLPDSQIDKKILYDPSSTTKNTHKRSFNIYLLYLLHEPSNPSVIKIRNIYTSFHLRKILKLPRKASTVEIWGSLESFVFFCHKKTKILKMKITWIIVLLGCIILKCKLTSARWMFGGIDVLSQLPWHAQH